MVPLVPEASRGAFARTRGGELLQVGPAAGLRGDSHLRSAPGGWGIFLEGFGKPRIHSFNCSLVES